MPTTIHCSPGDVVLVRFPFSDLATAKKRPALLLAQTSRSRRNALATVAIVTSQVEAPALAGDLLIGDWAGAGLLHPSLARLGKIATVDADLVEKRIGRLGRRDIAAAKTAFRLVFKAWA